MTILIGCMALLGTLVVYDLARRLYNRVGSPFLLPLAVSMVVIIFILLIGNISYETYMIGGEWINLLLGPAVVALAYPLYQQRETLRKLTIPIVVGTLFGAVIGVSTGILLAKWAHIDEAILYAVIPKSVTTPVSMAITESLGGATPLAAVFVMIAGIGGVLLSPLIFKYTGINHYVGRGVATGCGSHAIGTATIMKTNELEGSISTIAMVISAVVVSIITPGLIMLLL